MSHEHYRMKERSRKVSELEKAMMELVYQSRLTEMNINRLSEEMREFKEEMREFKNNTEMDIKKRSDD